MQIGLVTYTPERVKGFDLHVYYAKWADGSVFPAAEGMQNDVTCFCDAKAIRENPSIVATSSIGLALRRNRRAALAFDFVCPTNDSYRERILNYIEELSGSKVQGITLNLYHFPEEEFCVCPRCVELWRRSGLNWVEWRAQTVTNFLKEARKRVKGEFAVEIWPDPILAKQRFGLNFDQIADIVDYFHVPLSARDYATMYWVDTLARDFAAMLKKPVVVELSAEMLTEEKIDALLKTMAYLSLRDLKGILLLVHNAENAVRVCKYAVADSGLKNWLKDHNFTEMSQIIENWATLY
jgi:hypothetical protein